MYIFNYDNNDGFIIVSAEFMHQPIMAYSDHGEISPGSAPGGFLNWIGTTTEGVELLREGIVNNTEQASSAWQSYINLNKITITSEVNVALKKLRTGIDKKSGGNTISGKVDPWNPGDPDNCTRPNNTVGPLLPVTWGQGCSYNDLLDDKNCTTCGWSPKPYTGCVATSMAQIIRYWQYPSQYNYSSMPSNYGNYYVQELMRDAGNAVGMEYGCNGSGASGDRVVGALRNNFGFSSATYGEYDLSYNIVQQNINAGRPVILSACSIKNTNFFFFNSYNGCHMWVCDGYNAVNTCSASFLYFHMNWGWHEAGSTQDYNGWYGFDTWAPAGTNYKYARNIIYNIHP